MKEHVVINDDRTITVPTYAQKIGIQYDHNVNTLVFDCPRYSDDVDLSTMTVYINYLLSDGTLGAYLADNVRVDEANDRLMHFDWTIKNTVTQVFGLVTFLVCIKDVDDDGNELYHWNTEMVSKLKVSKGMENAASIIEKHPDLVTQLTQLVNKLKDGNEVAY